jgi:hypothetical protein
LLVAAYCEGDTRAQVVWQASCSLVQLLKQEVLAVALPMVALDVPDDALPVVPALPGTTHDVWQLAACELHVIMQLVVVELWARCSKAPPLAVLAAARPASANAIVRQRTTPSSLSPRRRSISQPRQKRNELQSPRQQAARRQYRTSNTLDAR